MTREQAIKVLKDWDGYFIGHSSDDVCDALEMAIKALEQEPFINKPCVSEKVCEHDKQMVLDKIRSEIDSHCSDNRDRNDGLYIAMRIIYKYQASLTGAEGSEE